jgi:hypothetical protein
MGIRPGRIVRSFVGSDRVGEAAAVAAATLVTRAAAPAFRGEAGSTWLPVVLYLLMVVPAGFVGAAAGAGPLARSRLAALTRLVVALAATLSLSAWSISAGASEGKACFAALALVLLALPAAPMAGGRLLEAELARRMPQLVAARLAARIGFSAALVAPAVLALLPRVRADRPALATLLAVALLLVLGVRRARDDAFVRELRLQARRADGGLPSKLRDELLATPLAPDVAALCPLSAEQFRAFRASCERLYARG